MPELHTKPSVLLLAQLAMTVKLIGKLLGEYSSLISVNDAETEWNSLLASTGLEASVRRLDFVELWMQWQRKILKLTVKLF